MILLNIMQAKGILNKTLFAQTIHSKFLTFHRKNMNSGYSRCFCVEIEFYAGFFNSA